MRGRTAAAVPPAVAEPPAVVAVPPVAVVLSALAAAGRRALWRGVFTLTGGLRVQGAAALPRPARAWSWPTTVRTPTRPR